METMNSRRLPRAAGRVLSDIVKRRSVRMPVARRGARHVLPGFAGLNRSAIEQNLEEVKLVFLLSIFRFPATSKEATGSGHRQ